MLDLHEISELRCVEKGKFVVFYGSDRCFGVTVNISKLPTQHIHTDLRLMQCAKGRGLGRRAVEFALYLDSVQGVPSGLGLL